ncbi:unnamed protein product [Bursaphelenchus okinawaensis]|uniref:Uncharacterized protein n=1 Tax=Bursaphelenchus okinawaensis TaxID=465554 RepID=A0A811LJB4_9BILA|nr:unnamed protein product [Bursaphelenchus okinawaensis]CAG9124710.1 unnamed protein product [Bursaphelenchus okinawaensis]
MALVIWHCNRRLRFFQRFTTCWRYKFTVMGFEQPMLKHISTQTDYNSLESHVDCVDFDIAAIFFVAVALSSVAAILVLFFTCWDYRKIWLWMTSRNPPPRSVSVSVDRVDSNADMSYRFLLNSV